eukprot:1003-Chlamydomonas_euryale.AAC.5
MTRSPIWLLGGRSDGGDVDHGQEGIDWSTAQQSPMLRMRLGRRVCGHLDERDVAHAHDRARCGLLSRVGRQQHAANRLHLLLVNLD